MFELITSVPSPSIRVCSYGVVALTEEVHSLRGKLRDAQMLQAELQEQLVPVERLKAQIRKEKQMRAQAEQQIDAGLQ
eukprot:g9123.t1